MVAVNMNKAFEVSRNHNGNNFAMVRYRAFLGGVRRSKLERSCATKKKTKLRPELRTRTADLLVAAAAPPSRPAARLGSVSGCASRSARCRQPADATTCPPDSDPGALASPHTNLHARSWTAPRCVAHLEWELQRLDSARAARSDPPPSL